MFGYKHGSAPSHWSISDTCSTLSLMYSTRDHRDKEVEVVIFTPHNPLVRLNNAVYVVMVNGGSCD